MSSAAPAILVRDLHKRYGDHHAVRGIDFEVAPGEVFGLLGPNGAGKTTTVEILEGYRTRTSGIVSVLGNDPQQRSHELRERMGIVLQSTGMYRHIAVREAIAHWARFYPAPRTSMCRYMPVLWSTMPIRARNSCARCWGSCPSTDTIPLVRVR